MEWKGTPQTSAFYRTLREVAPLAGVVLLVLLAYTPALQGDFVWDDRVLIVDSALVRELRPIDEYLTQSFWSGSLQGESLSYYRPLTTFSFAVDWALWGRNPFGFHLSNLLLHALCCGLLFALCRRAGASPIAAALATGLFGLMPRCTESVAWISGRTDLIACAGALGALALWRSDPGAVLSRLLSACALFAGLLGKETALAAAPALLILEGLRARREQDVQQALLNVAPILVAATSYLAIRALVHPGAPPPEAVPMTTRALWSLQALGAYATMLVDPLRPRLQIGMLGVVRASEVLAGAAAALGIAGLAFLASRRSWPPLRVAGGALALAALLPVLHLVSLPLKVVAADRFLYLPYAGIALALVTGIASIPDRFRRVAGIGAALALPALASATALRAQDWSNDVALWSTAVERSDPSNSRPPLMLAEALLRRGEAERALELLERSLRIDAEHESHHGWADSSEPILGNMAGALTSLGREEEAVTIMRELIARHGDHPKHHYNLAILYARMVRFADSLAELDRALAIQPDYAAALDLRPIVADAHARWSQLPDRSSAEPASVRAERALVLAGVGRRDQARDLWEQIIRDPSSPADLVEIARRHLQRGSADY